jgi:GNAT superfamily N-acetyltransferase
VSEQLIIRPIAPEDSIEDLTSLIHRAYARHTAAGLRYWATHQTVEDTHKRIATGECFVATRDGVIVGTILLQPPSVTRGSEWYDRPDVAAFFQFAVEPDLRGTGIGRALLDHVEARAKELGATEIALDTAKPATDLIEMYEHLGYRVIGDIDWRPHTNYLSVTLSKTLG